MKFVLLFFLFTSFLFSSEKFEDTYDNYLVGKHELVLEDFETLALEDLDFEAAYILGRMYERGEGCEIDLDKALYWYEYASKGYYNKSNYDTRREVYKEQDSLYKSIEIPENKETADTIKRHALSLYNVKAYKYNYFLPMSYRTDENYGLTNNHEAKKAEMEFQLSLKYDFGANFFGFSEYYTAGYTQLSFWQSYSESAYFRETNYNPEFFVTFPFSPIYDNDYLKFIRFTLAHQSNGRGGAEERSWNYIKTSMLFQFKVFFAKIKLWHRFEDTIDYNPELIDYIGHGELELIFPYRKHLAKLNLRNNFDGISATTLHYTHPVFAKKDLFLYIKYFNGYGESLIDYDNNINKIGIGFSISR